MNSPNTPPPPASPYDGYGYGPVLPPAGPSPAERLRRYLILLRKYWWIPAITILLALGAAAAYAYLKAPVYVSKARLWVTGRMNLPGNVVFSEDLQNYFGTQITLLESPRLAQLALERLRLANPSSVLLDPEGKPVPVAIEAAQARRSAVFDLTATGPTPGYTQAYLEALMGAFLEYRQEARAEASGETLTSLSEQVRRHEEELKAEQDKLIAFRQTNNLAMLQEQGSAAGAYVVKLMSQLADYRLESQLLEATALDAEKAGARSTNNLGGVTTSPAATNVLLTAAGPGSDLQTAGKQLEMLRIQRDQLSRFLRPAHPKMVKLNEEIERGERLLQVFREQTSDQLASARQALKLKIEALEASIRDWETKLAEANNRLVEYDRLRQNVDRMQSLRDRLLPLVQSVNINRSIDQDTISVLEAASEAKPDRKLPMVLALALFLGVGAGLSLILLIDLADDRLYSSADVNLHFDEEIVGQIPELPQARRKPKPILLQRDDTRHAFAESYRCLRSSLLFGQNADARPKTILVTSTEPNEGKSTVAANLALTLAAAGSRVLLIDADLRRSSVHRFFRIDREPGLGNLLEQQADPDRFGFIAPTADPNLYVIPSGKPAGNCGELILSKTFDRLLAQVRQDFDFTIFDSIPVFASDDATTLAPKLDGVLFVVRGGRSRARLVRQALELLYQRQAKVLGLVFNRADSTSGRYPYYQYAEYYAQPPEGESKAPVPLLDTTHLARPKSKKSPSFFARLFGAGNGSGSANHKAAPRIIVQKKHRGEEAGSTEQAAEDGGRRTEDG